MTVTVTIDEEVVSKTCYELEDVSLIEMMLNALDLAHQHAETPQAANTVTVSKCAFEAIVARWLPLEAFGSVWRRAVGTEDGDDA